LPRSKRSTMWSMAALAASTARWAAASDASASATARASLSWARPMSRSSLSRSCNLLALPAVEERAQAVHDYALVGVVSLIEDVGKVDAQLAQLVLDHGA